MKKYTTQAFLALVLGAVTTLASYFGFLYFLGEDYQADALSTEWIQINQDGFGQIPINKNLTSMASVDGNLYVASQNNTADQAVLWKHSRSNGQDTFTEITSTSCGSADIQEFNDMIEHDGKLYVTGLDNSNGSEVFELLTSATTCSSSNAISASGLSGNISANESVASLISYKGELFAIVSDNAGLLSGAAFFRYDSSTWTQLTSTVTGANGFTAIDERIVTACEASGSAVYCATDEIGSTRLYAADLPTTGTTVTWTSVEPSVVGASNNGSITDILAVDSDVYFGVNGITSTSAARVYKYSETSSALSLISADGFGSSDNDTFDALGELNGYVYAATSNGTSSSNNDSRVFRYTNSGTSWVRANLDGFGVSNVRVINQFVRNDSNLYAGLFKNNNGEVDASRVYRLHDTDDPTFGSFSPAPLSTASKNTNISFSVEDDTTGIDITSLSVTVTGSVSGVHTYSSSNVLASISSSNSRIHNVTVNPDADFEPGETVRVEMSIDDRYVDPNTGSDAFSFVVTAPDDTKPTVCSVSQPSFIATGAGKTGAPHVKTYKPDGTELSDFYAFSRSLRSGVRVTTGDVDRDGVDEVIVGSGEGATPHVRVFAMDGTLKPIDFRPFHPNSKTGVDVAAGDVDGDGKDEIFMSQFRNGEAWVKIYRYNADKTVLGEWVAYERGQEFGASIAAADIDYDGKAEIVTTPGPPGDPHVRVFEYNGDFKGDIHAFPAYGFPETRRGMDVSAGDTDNDGKDEIAVSVVGQTQSWTKVYRWNNEKHVLAELKPYAVKWVGTNISLGDVDNDCKAEIVTGPGFGGGPHVRGFETDHSPISGLDFFSFNSSFRGGTDVEVGYRQ